MHRLMINNAAAAHALDSDRQAELIKALTDQIAALQAHLAEYQEIAWLFEEVELAAGERHVLIEKRDGEVWLSIRGQLSVGQSLKDAARHAFETTVVVTPEEPHS